MANSLPNDANRLKTIEYILKVMADSYKLVMRGDDGRYGLRSEYGMRWGFYGYSKHGEKVYGYVSIDEQALSLPNKELAELLTRELRSLAASILNYSGKPVKKKRDLGITEAPKLENELGEVSP